MSIKKIRRIVSLILSGAVLFLGLVSCGEKINYSVGDIVMSDGTVLNADSYSEYAGTASPVAVIFSVNGANSENSDRVLGIALEDCTEDAAVIDAGLYDVLSDNAHFQAALVKNQVYLDNKAEYKNEGFTGILDGREITYNFTNEDKKLIKENAKYLPAYNAAVSYGKDKNWKKYRDDWYFPSAAEMYELYRTRNEVNKSLIAAGSTELKEKQYWTSSSSYEVNRTNYIIDFSNGHLLSVDRLEKKNVRAIYCFYEGREHMKRKHYTLGDIIMSDGSVISPLMIESYTGKAKPMAVIFSMRGGHFEESDRVLGVGLEISSPLKIAEDDSAGVNTNFLANQSTLIGQEYGISKGTYSNSGFVGLMDGRKTWDNIAFYDKNAGKSFKDYPAFEFAVQYGKEHGFSDYKKGWYLPTASEAYELAEVIGIVNFSLEKCGAKPMKELIWTSSQIYGNKECQYIVNLDNRNVERAFKNVSYNVCSIYCF